MNLQMLNRDSYLSCYNHAIANLDSFIVSSEYVYVCFVFWLFYWCLWASGLRLLNSSSPSFFVVVVSDNKKSSITSSTNTENTDLQAHISQTKNKIYKHTTKWEGYCTKKEGFWLLNIRKTIIISRNVVLASVHYKFCVCYYVIHVCYMIVRMFFRIW